MESLPLSEFAAERAEEAMEKFIEEIPDGHAVSVQSAIDQTGLTSRQKWIAIAGDRCLARYFRNNLCKVLVNGKTAKALQGSTK